MEFVNLYIQSEYSLLHSTVKLNNDFASRLIKDQATSCAIVDNDSMYGAIKFYNLCKVHNIKPIIGLKLSLKSNYSYNNQVLLYAMNYDGYVNLMKLSTIRKSSKSDLNIDALYKYRSGVLAILPASENETCKLYLNGKVNYFEEEINKYQNIFEELYIGLDLQGSGKHNVISEFYCIKNKYNLKLVGLHRVNYMKDSEFEAFKLLRCVDMNCNSYTPISSEEFWNYASREDLMKEFNRYPELINATSEVAKKCNLEIEFGKYKLPSYSDEIENTQKYLHDLCVFGLKKRLTDKKVDANKYIKRLDYELKIINKMGFNDYFLIVYDFIKWAKKNQILVGPGRGSGPSSLVSYSLGITEIDPIEYDLLFERFLNEERVTMPDIDTDFPDNKRDEVIKYVGQKYGKMRVAHISTFGTYGPKGALRDIARVKQIPDLFINELLKVVANRPSLKECYDDELFNRIINENKNLKEACELAQVIEGIPRNISTHAAGVIMTKDELVNYTPLQPGMNGLSQTQYEAGDLEKLGLLKMDFLGIRNLSIIDEVVNEIASSEGIKININKIPLDDEATYKLISSGETDGIFQLESGGMRNVLKKMQPTNIMDVANVNALYRPGPMEMIPEFIECKFGRKKVSYLHKDLAEILAPTYGVIVFQEQIMLIAQKFAGYTLGEADILRRAVSKKKREVLESEREKFVRSSMRLGYDSKISNHIYDYIVKFANYGFNKSHAVVYSILAYQMAYLKTHYYRYFMANMMSSSINSVNLMQTYIANCRKHGILVAPPSINYSSNKCETYVRMNKHKQKIDVIYYPLLGINNVGGVIVHDLLEERKNNGLYQNYEEFVRRTKSIINKRVLANLVHSGALDDFKLTRKTMIEKYDDILMRSDYGLLKDELTEIEYSKEEYSLDEISIKEQEALGFNIKYNLLLKYNDQKVKYHCIDIASMVPSRRSNVLAILKRVKIIKTKKNDEMAFIELFDGVEQIDGVIFPETYKKVKSILQENGVYIFTGSLELRNDKKQIIIENAFTIR